METKTKSKYNYEKRQGLRQWIDATGKQISAVKNYLKDYTRHHTVQWKKFEGTHDGPDGWGGYKNVVPSNWHRVAPMENVNMRELERLQREFRAYHVAASMMRGKTIAEIETLPTRKTKIGPNYGSAYLGSAVVRACNQYGYFREPVDMNKVHQIMKEYENEDVHSDSRGVDVESTGSASGSRPSGVSSKETGNGADLEKPKFDLPVSKGFRPKELHVIVGG